MDVDKSIDEVSFDKGLDFHYLLSEAIQWIRQLSGNKWNDYNEHDPGITILEQLCFALVDLSYRTSFDVQNYYQYQNSKNSPFQPKEIVLPCNPVTTNDYRKYLLDEIKEATSLWIYPVQHLQTPFAGLYTILVDADNTYETIQSQVKKTYLECRNLGEDLHEVIVAKKIPIQVGVKVEINDTSETEFVLVEIYSALKQFFSPAIKYYTTEDLTEEGLNYDEIFSGPLLKNGFIKENELLPKMKSLELVDVQNIIKSIEGVRHVDDLYFILNNQIIYNSIAFNDDEVPFFVNNLIDISLNTLLIFKNSFQQTKLDNRIINNYLSGKNFIYKKHTKIDAEIEFIKMNNLDEYVSVQNDFPIVYGIGEYGLSNSVSDFRKMQAKQLKGYLVLFEQIMSNFLAQLAHISDLYSIKPISKQTYFYNSLENSIPDISPILMTDGYRKFIDDALDNHENYFNRRNRFLNYMLSLHGEESLDEYFKMLCGDLKEDDIERRLLSVKEHLLSHIIMLNRDKSRSYNYWKEKDIGGVVFRLSILLSIAMRDYKEGQTAKIYDVEHLLLRPKLLSKSFGICILDKDSKTIFKSNKTYSYDDSLDFKNRLIMAFQFEEKFSVEMTEESKFKIRIKIDADEEYLESVDSNESVDWSYKYLQLLYEELKFSKNTISHYIQYENKDTSIDLSFYNNRISVVLEAFSEDINSIESKNIVEKMIKGYYPVHCCVDIIWLTHEKINHFEVLYGQWRKELSVFVEEEMESGKSLAAFLWQNSSS